MPSEFTNLHICAPEPTTISYRVLAKRCRLFRPGRYPNWRDAFEAGLADCSEGFRVFRQTTYEWYEPLNQELIKVDARLAKYRKEGR